MRTLIILLLFGAVGLDPIYSQNVVVWDFTTRDGEENQTTENFTYEFEEALVNLSSVSVLERRNLDRLVAVIENERSVQEVLQMSDSTLNDLEKLGVEQVVFGEVFDDIDGGEVSIRVIFQELNGKITDSKSVHMRRGLLADGISRRDKINELVEDLDFRLSRDVEGEPQLPQGRNERTVDTLSYRKNIRNNILRSYIVPGSEQLYSGKKTKGSILLVGSLISIGTTVTSLVLVGEYTNQRSRAENIYNQTVPGGNWRDLYPDQPINDEWDAFQNAIDNLDTVKRVVLISSIISVSFLLVNAVDVSIHNRKKDPLTRPKPLLDSRMKLMPLVNMGHKNTSYGFSIAISL